MNDSNVCQFEEEGHVMLMEVNKGDESYASSSEDSTENTEDEEEIVDHEVSFRTNRSDRSRSRSRTVDPTSDSQSVSSQEEFDATNRQTEEIKRQLEEIKVIQNKQQRIRELDMEMDEKLQEIHKIMESEGLPESTRLIAEQMLKDSGYDVRPKKKLNRGINVMSEQIRKFESEFPGKLWTNK